MFKLINVFLRRSIFVLASGVLSFTVVGSALADSVVKTTLWDKGESSMSAMDTVAPMGMAMPGAKMEMATMGIASDVNEIAAGEITFKVVNDSTSFYHSMLIVALDDPSAQLPYLADKKMVDEGNVRLVARTKDLKPHDAASVKAVLEPGTYILLCNVAGHYAMGMWAKITVTP